MPADHDSPAHRPKPSLTDWLLLAISSTFVVAGLILLRREPGPAIVTIALFGTGLALAVMNIGRKLRDRGFRATHVAVAGGVPLRPRRGRLLLFSGWTLGLGVILFVFGAPYPPLFRWLAAFVAIVGVVWTLGVISGRMPGGFLQFDPEYFTVARRGWLARIPWDRIVGVLETEQHSNPVLLIAVDDLNALTIEPPQARAKALRAMAKSDRWAGAPFAIMTTHYGIDLPVLSATLTRYIADPQARRELARRALT